MFEVTRKVLEGTWAHLRAQGDKDEEGVVYWGAGRATQGPRRIAHFETPARYAEVGRYHAIVDLDELMRIGDRFNQQEERIVARVHSHAEGAFHSEVDEGSPLTGRPGFVSIVVGGFARAPIDLARCPMFEWTSGGEWLELHPAQRRAGFRVVS